MFRKTYKVNFQKCYTDLSICGFRGSAKNAPPFVIPQSLNNFGHANFWKKTFLASPSRSLHWISCIRHWEIPLKQECIPVGYVPPHVTIRVASPWQMTETVLDRDPHGQRTPGQRTPDREPLDTDPHGQRPPAQTEISPVDRQTPVKT